MYLVQLSPYCKKYNFILVLQSLRGDLGMHYLHSHVCFSNRSGRKWQPTFEWSEVWHTLRTCQVHKVSPLPIGSHLPRALFGSHQSIHKTLPMRLNSAGDSNTVQVVFLMLCAVHCFWRFFFVGILSLSIPSTSSHHFTHLSKEAI